MLLEKALFMRFEVWYLRQNFSKRKALSIGLLLVILSVTLISAGPTEAYFHIAGREANSVRIENSLVKVYFAPQILTQSNLSSLRNLTGVHEVIPILGVNQVEVSVGGKVANETIEYLSSADATKVFRLLGFDALDPPAQSNWLYFGYTSAENNGIQIDKPTEANVAGIGTMVTMGSGTTYSDSDFYVFGDIQSYWASPAALVKSGEYNTLFMIATNSSVANSLGPQLSRSHPGWFVNTPSQFSSSAASAASEQLLFALSLSAVSWAFGLVVFAIYVAREISTRNKELVTLEALGASRGILIRCLVYYLIILTSVGCVLGLILSLGLVMPGFEVVSYGYPLVESFPTIANTVVLMLVPVLALDLAIVVILQSRLSRLDMMSFLRSEV
jgi:ABC-type antimicrobial peptide transport system permease subunit